MWTVNAKDVESLTVQLAHDSKDITTIIGELDQQKNSNSAKIETLQKLLNYKYEQ